MDNFEYKTIPGFSRYSINRNGVVIDTDTNRTRNNFRSSCGYATVLLYKNGKRYARSVHRLLAITFLNCKKGNVVDHIDGNQNNNNIDNLRVCTRQQNIQNMHSRRGASKYKGVHWHKRDMVWMARIGVNGKRVWLGQSKDEVVAAKLYDEAARKHFGEFANVNFA